MKMRHSFTLVELVVAVGLLTLMLAFSSIIFKVSINSCRVSGANAEIMQKLRAITNQLSADFEGTKAQLYYIARLQVDDGVRNDSFAFFANGDFQSTGQYDYEDAYGNMLKRTVAGNVAAIYYGIADPLVDGERTILDTSQNKVLVRRQTILVAHSAEGNFSYNKNDFGADPHEFGEFRKTSLSQWRGVRPFTLEEMVETQELDVNDASELTMYMAKGVDDFAFEWLCWDNGKFYWYPNDKDVKGMTGMVAIDSRVFKFSFTLYDSRGVIKDGKRFSHIIYVGRIIGK